MADSASCSPLVGRAPDLAVLEPVPEESGPAGLPAYDPSVPLAAHAKRFFERWLADESFRAQLLDDPEAARRRFDLAVVPEDVRWLWDDDCRAALAETPLADVIATSGPASRRLLAWIQANDDYRRRLRTDSRPIDPAFAAWRERQIARAATTFRAAYDHNTPHITFAAELSRGCSVGCWFCGVSAPRLGDVLAYDRDNATLFRSVLETLVTRVGTASAALGFLYWATDPFDNPDYELFCADFQQVCGAFPLTTTALALRDVERTRRFLALAERAGAHKVRFSISTLRQLDRIHAEFSAEELALVDLITLNKGSLLQPAPSGRARERLSRAAESRPGPFAVEALRDQTISCVSGFLLNLVERRVQLITPCNSNDRWPLGYYVYADRRFADAAELGTIIDEAVARHMPSSLPAEAVVRFRGDLRFEPKPDGFALAGPHGTCSYSGNVLLADFGAAIASGERSARAVTEDYSAFGIEEVAGTWLEGLFKAGLLDEEPAQ